MASVTYGKTAGKFNGSVQIALDANEKKLVKAALGSGDAAGVNAAKSQALSLFRDALTQEEARISTNFDAEIARLQAEKAKTLDFGTIE